MRRVDTEAAPSSTPEYSRSYVYAGSRLLSTATNVSGTEIIEFHHPDRLGTRLVTNPSAGTYYQQSTLPFGTALGAESTGFSNQVFTSYDRSASTGLDYAVNRTYSQGQSRFTQPDPIGMSAASLGDPQSLNMFAYVQNMPTDFVDPSGLDGGPIFEDIVIRVHTRIRGLERMGGSGGGGVFVTEAPPEDGEGPIDGGGNGDCPPGPTVCAAEKLKDLARQAAKKAAERKRRFFECLRSEMKEEVAELHSIMYKNLRKWGLKTGGGSAGGILRRDIIFAAGGIGMLIGSLVALNDWYDDIKDFNNNVFEPARQAAIKKCREITGYQGKL